MTKRNNEWADLALNSWMLSMEAGFVMWLRTARLMGGGKIAETEAQRMVSEKALAAMTLWPFLMAGGLSQSPESRGQRALTHYAKPVRANRKRLSRR